LFPKNLNPEIKTQDFGNFNFDKINYENF